MTLKCFLLQAQDTIAPEATLGISIAGDCLTLPETATVSTYTR